MADASMAPPARNSRTCATTGAPNSSASSGAEATSSDGAMAARNTNPSPETKQLIEKPGVEYTCHIRSEKGLEEFEAAMKLLNAGKDRSHMVADYPKTEDKYSMCVHALFDAIKNLAGIDEASAKDGIAVRFIKSKTSIEIELVGARLMRAMRLAQLGQLSFVGKTIQEYDSFEERFYAVRGALKISKLLARSAFESDDWLNRIALNPREELQRKRMNKEVNDNKKEKQKLATMAMKQDPNLNFKTPAKTAAATKRPAPPATTSRTIQEQAQQSFKQDSSGTPDVRQMGADTSSDERPSKRAKTSHDQAKLQVAQALDGTAAVVLDPDPMNVPGPVRDYVLRLHGQRHAADAPQSRNSLARPDAPGANQTEEAEDEDFDLDRLGD